MRREADEPRIRELLARLGQAARTPVRAYLVGGATAVLHGWRASTIDVDLTFEPEPREVYEALPKLKEELELNIELASPAHFVPALPGWRERCRFIGTFGRLTAFHYDPYGQALAKVERDHATDRIDVRHLIDEGLVDPPRLLALFVQVEDELVRFPAVDPDTLRSRLEALR